MINSKPFGSLLLALLCQPVCVLASNQMQTVFVQDKAGVIISTVPAHKALACNGTGRILMSRSDTKPKSRPCPQREAKQEETAHVQ